MKQHKPSIKESLERWEEAPQQGPGEAEQVRAERQSGSHTDPGNDKLQNYKWWEMNAIRYYKTGKDSSRKQNKVIKGSKDSKHLNEVKLSELNAGMWKWEEIMDDSKFSCFKLKAGLTNPSLKRECA